MPWIALDPSVAAAAPVVTTGAPKISIGDTLADFQAKLVKLLLNRVEVVGNTVDQVKWINQGYRHLCTMLDIPQVKASFTLDITSGQPLYHLPVTPAGFEAMAAIKQVGIGDGSSMFFGEGMVLDPIDEFLYRSLADEADEPRCYFRWGEMLVLWPTPVAARTLVLDGIIRPQDLSLPAHSPILPLEFHEAIPLAAKAKVLRDLRESQQQLAAENDLVSFLRPITDYAAEEKSQHHGRMTPIRSWAELKRRRR